MLEKLTNEDQEFGEGAVRPVEEVWKPTPRAKFSGGAPRSRILWPSNGPPNPGTVLLAIGVLFFVVAFWTAIIWGITAAVS
jgi:hypothetical protein